MATLTVEFVGLILFSDNGAGKFASIVNTNQPLADLPMHDATLQMLEGTIVQDNWAHATPSGYTLNQFGDAPFLEVTGIDTSQPLNAQGWDVIHLQSLFPGAKLPPGWARSGRDRQKLAILPLLYGTLTSCMLPPIGPPPGPIVSRWVVPIADTTLLVHNVANTQWLLFDGSQDVRIQFYNTDGDPDDTDDAKHFNWFWWTTGNANVAWGIHPTTSPITTQCPGTLNSRRGQEGGMPATPYGIGCSNSNYP